MSKPDISITFPCYNEAENVGPMIESSLAVLERVANRYEVVVSNDGSTDGTREVAEDYAAKHPDVVRVVNQYPNRGYGHALKSGLAACRYDWVFFTDGDRQFDLDEIDKLIPFLDDHDIVTGYRGRRKDPFVRKLNSAGWNLIARILLGIKVKDVNCAFRFYRKTTLDAITIDADGAMINVEMWAKFYRLGARIKEVNVTHLPRTHGEQSGADVKVILKAFRELFRMYRRLKRDGRS